MKNLVIALFCFAGSGLFAAAGLPLKLEFDPASANGRITYQVPADAPDEIVVTARYRLADDDFAPATVNKYRSETATRIVGRDRSGLLAREQKEGRVTEYLAAGRSRTLLWTTAGQLPYGDRVAGELRLTIAPAAEPETILAEGTASFAADFSRVVMLDRFAGNPAIHPDIVSPEKLSAPGWYQSAEGLEVYEKEDLLEPLMYRPELTGYYAIYLAVPRTGYGEIEVELTGDGFSQRFAGFDGHEYFWKMARLDGEHFIIRQPYRTLGKLNDALRARLRYVKFVPVTEAEYRKYAANRTAKRDKFVAAYFEPYSWAFRDFVTAESKFLEAAAAYREAGVDLVDTQVGRGGSKPQYPSAIELPLLGKTRGDAPAGSKESPFSLGTGRMIRLTDPARAMLRAGKAYDLAVSINFGAANNYKGGELEGALVAAKPELFIDRFFLDYANPEARRALLVHFEEVLRRGARRLSLDFCRYPHGVRSPEDANAFLRELRQLADRYRGTGDRITILVRFPVPGCKGIDRQNSKFQPAVWIREKLIDFLVPADFAGMPQFDVRPFVAMAKGSRVKVLPCIEGLKFGPPFPGAALDRADEFYRAGADGLYVYQADAHIVGSMTGLGDVDHDTFRTFGSSELVRQAVAREKARHADYSTDVYWNFPLPYQSYRALFWIEGVTPEKVEMYIDGELVTSRTAPPWMLGEQGFENHYRFLGKDKKAKAVLYLPGGKTLTKEFDVKLIARSISF